MGQATISEAVRREISWVTNSLTDLIIKAGARYLEIKGRLSKIDRDRDKELYALYEHDLAMIEDYIRKASLLKALLEAVSVAVTNGKDIKGLLEILYKERRSVPEFMWSIEWITDALKERGLL